MTYFTDNSLERLMQQKPLPEKRGYKHKASEQPASIPLPVETTSPLTDCLLQLARRTLVEMA